MPNQQTALKAALAWYLDAGVDEVLLETAQDYTTQSPPSSRAERTFTAKGPQQGNTPHTHNNIAAQAKAAAQSIPATGTDAVPLGTSEAHAKALSLIKDIKTLQGLEAALAGFDGLAVKNTATNMVFADGNPKARVMVIGEAPGAEEDLQGTPFVGPGGYLLDKIFGSIGLSRSHNDPAQSLYITNIMNWRPPGNRTPSTAEINISLPFIEKHIAVVKPEILILTGSIPATALLNTKIPLSKLRNKWHEYSPQTPGIKLSIPIPALVTYHPAYLLRTPVQKRAVWQDMLALRAKLTAPPKKT